jgi:hypothetical protein
MVEGKPFFGEKGQQRGKGEGMKPVLKFPESDAQGFKILQIADTQIESFETDVCRGLTVDEEAYPCNAYNTTSFIARLIAVEAPDLVYI